MRLFLFSILIAIFALLPQAKGQEYAEGDLAEWTMMVFLNADNNLYNAGLDDLVEMKKVGSAKDVNIVVQFDGQNKGDSRRYFVKKAELIVEEDFAGSSGEVDMGNWKNLVDFVLWAMEKHPAKRYFVDVWNHGSGWLKLRNFNMGRGSMLQAISYDDTSGTHMNTLELGQALRAITGKLGRKVDIYGSDACLMGMMEVIYEIKDFASYVVGAESTEPGDGWPYDDFLKKLTKEPSMDGRRASSALVEVYRDSYSGGSQGSSEVTLASVDTNLVNDLAVGLDLISDKLKSLLPKEALRITKAIKGSQVYELSANRDVKHFLENIGMEFAENKELVDIVADFERVFEAVVVKSIYVDDQFKDSHGIAIWLPADKYSFDSEKDDYAELAFAKTSLWPSFLGALYLSQGPSDFEDDFENDFDFDF